MSGRKHASRPRASLSDTMAELASTSPWPAMAACRA
ncbi:Uncharacterised protein [Bordetella pertussis]|nr:Uncharacterised protein [Bordetella pertussis]